MEQSRQSSSESDGDATFLFFFPLCFLCFFFRFFFDLSCVEKAFFFLCQLKQKQPCFNVELYSYCDFLFFLTISLFLLGVSLRRRGETEAK